MSETPRRQDSNSKMSKWRAEYVLEVVDAKTSFVRVDSSYKIILIERGGICLFNSLEPESTEIER